MERVETKLRKGEQGFTLVELAIVMIIIGLLITGVLKGQEMIANAQVTSTVAQMKAVDAATSTFRDTFNALPGDITNVAVRLPAVCLNSCLTNGNGNGFIDQDPGAAATTTNEMGTYFMHLAAVDLLSGINPGGTTLLAGDQMLGAEIENAIFRVGFVPTNTVPTGNQGGAANTWRQGHYLTVAGVAGVVVGGATGDAMTPIQATRIDNKVDDGAPQTGSVRAGGLANCVAGNVYNGNNTQTACSVFYRIQG